jgi:lipopolysaccharide biosynthesis regulator YciM
MDAFTRVGHAEEGLKLLRSWLDATPSIDLLETVVKSTRAVHGSAAANEVARLELHRSPSLLALAQYLDTRGQLELPTQEDRTDLDVVRGLLHQHTRRIGRYVCTQCGFKARNFYWQCPGCTNWETYPPRRTEDADPSRT